MNDIFIKNVSSAPSAEEQTAELVNWTAAATQAINELQMRIKKLEEGEEKDGE